MSGIWTVMSGIWTKSFKDTRNMASFHWPYSGHRIFHKIYVRNKDSDVRNMDNDVWNMDSDVRNMDSDVRNMDRKY